MHMQSKSFQRLMLVVLVKVSRSRGTLGTPCPVELSSSTMSGIRRIARLRAQSLRFKLLARPTASSSRSNVPQLPSLSRLHGSIDRQNFVLYITVFLIVAVHRSPTGAQDDVALGISSIKQTRSPSGLSGSAIIHPVVALHEMGYMCWW